MEARESHTWAHLAPPDCTHNYSFRRSGFLTPQSAKDPAPGERSVEVKYIPMPSHATTSLETGAIPHHPKPFTNYAPNASPPSFCTRSPTRTSRREDHQRVAAGLSQTLQQSSHPASQMDVVTSRSSHIVASVAAPQGSPNKNKQSPYKLCKNLRVPHNLV